MVYGGATFKTLAQAFTQRLSVSEKEKNVFTYLRDFGLPLQRWGTTHQRTPCWGGVSALAQVALFRSLDLDHFEMEINHCTFFENART